MMKQTLSLLFISLILILPFCGAADADPKIELIHPLEIEPNRVVVIDVKLHNTTSEMLWDLKALIDLSDVPIEIKKYITIIDGEKEFAPGDGDHSINVQDQVSVRLSLEVSPNAEAGVYKIPLKIKGEIGNCRQGCKPYLLMKSIDFKVVKEFPSVKIELSSYPNEVYPGQSVNVPFKISNHGQGYANSIKLSSPSNNNYTSSFDISSVGMLRSNESRNISLNIAAKNGAPSGDYRADIIVEYFDAFGNKKATTQSVSFSIKDSALAKEAEKYYSLGNEYYTNKNYSNALIQYEKSKEAYKKLGLTEKVNEVDARIELVKIAIGSTKSSVSTTIYILFGVLLSAVTMELGVLIGILTRKPKLPKSSSITKKLF